MKFLKVGLSAALAAMVMLTSCLSEGNNEQSGYVFGVVSMNTFSSRPLFYMNDYSFPLYSNSLSQYLMEDDTYVQAYVVYNLQDENNTDIETKGYIVGSIQTSDPLDKISIKNNSEINPEEPYENEVALAALEVETYVRKAIISGTAISSIPEDSKVIYIAEYDANQEPEIDNSNRRIYDIYIRATVEEGTKTKKNHAVYQAYRFDSYFSIIENKEKEVDDDYFHIRLNYASEVDHEKSEIKWTNTLIPTYVEKK